ncbi:vacuolar protein sorting/targeting protein PEP1 [Exophiala xenobiotica]|nr:vacuolar protein sorting/targeting protein PEP1 [Exophiala xenobiotica]KAK5393944.1 vacuolar protein sorting/targeting protein PEP1 [Exophiala xenobiotica]KAK5408213.1 vacuolar protein sorting/targeting protein PEP1 [Exophiala xenobiotica]KAK5456377.1 vacuolar protein sorting/targeting protein PEP1 [Exophiala xenobiotica]KAK5472279.1 vacuolar protein sorting/targeting protein PEP1 [Exophiala xenobiotica]
MILRSFCRSAVASSLALLLLLSSPQPTQAKKDGPTISSTKFEHALENVFYFDDSNIILAQDRDLNSIWRSADAGETWKEVTGDDQSGNAWDLVAHPWDNQRAYILGLGSEHWITTDRGETWRRFTTQGAGLALFRPSPLSFHGRDAKKVIWNGEQCVGLACAEVALFTEDDFKTVTKMGSQTRGCQWAVGTPDFAEDIAAEVKDRVFCIVEGLYSPWPKDNRLLVSDNFFDDGEIEPSLDDGRAVTGIISMAAVKGYLVAAAKSEGTDELALYVTKDASQWHRAEFGQHRINEDAYTILESTNYSMQVDVLGSRPANPMGYLFTSNSNGTYFTRNIDHTNRNIYGRVDFEKVQNIQGIVLVNVVENHKEVEDSILIEKNIYSQISFDDGRTFQDLKVKDKRLNLHSVTDARQSGRIFSSPAPGIVMGVGNTGKFLKSYNDGDLFVSDDAGVTWYEGLDGAHLYEFGNQGAVIVAVDDEDTTSHIRFSIDHGKKWTEADLGEKIRAKFITTVPDSTTLKFLLMGSRGSGSKTEWFMFKIDFEGLHERACKSSDFERWPARVDDDGKPSCMMGHKQFYQRRKADAECFIDEEFKDPEPEFEPCKCTMADFECDYNYVRDPDDRTKCLPAAPIPVPKGECKNEKDTFKGPSGWRLIPGNECTRDGGEQLDKEVERPCSDANKTPATGDIAVKKTNFNADRFSEWYYLERGSSAIGTDETIIMRTSEQDIYLSHDHGRTWEPILKGEPITAIAPNPNHHDVVYFLTGSTTVHYTIDRGSRFDKFAAPERPSTLRLPTLRFHPEYKDWLLWSGSVGRDDHTNIFFSKDRGDNWETMVRYARKCEFITRESRPNSDQLIYCEQYQDENPDKNLMLLSSENFFGKSEVHFSDILDFATMSEFIIVAAKTEDSQGLKVDASIDGHTFAPAEFPKNFQVAHQQAYTVLDSSTHAVFLHVTVNALPDREYGAIIKSNSNGTSYVFTLDAVNRDTEGYVDFEKMQGLEGVAMTNVVSNLDEVNDGGKKKLKTMITHNDGAQWTLLPPPKKDAIGSDYQCVKEADKATDQCSLHIHSYTERSDKSATFSSPSAVGLMMAVGNVGNHLLRKDDESTDTFITRDAGITWSSVKKGSYMWEYGDQGSIIVIVKESQPTKSLFYTLDEGRTWKEFEFSPSVEMQIDAITTVPSDNSLNFLLWGREVGNNAKRGIFTVAVDFSGLKERQRPCELDEQTPQNEDYMLWEPKHPMQDSNCLFGHVAQYHRKRTEAQCYNGKMITHIHSIAQNCTCTRQDFECDYNFQPKADGTCALVPGYDPPNHAENCRKNPDQVEFWYPTGYRRIPLTTCQGGQELDKVESQACPGHEQEYEKKHGISGAALFFAITVPLAAAAGVGYWVYTRWQAGFAGFGQIRLGESMAGATGGSGESPLISIPVAVVSAIVAVVKATPLLIMSIWRNAKGYMPLGSGGGGGGGRFGIGRDAGAGYGAPYRSRDAFARRGQDYSQVVEDDELLGDGLDDEEEV